MTRPSKIKQLAPEARTYIETLLRQDTHTLDEMLVLIREKFPSDVPSRSSLGRYSQSVAEMSGRMKDIQTAASALVANLGENVNDKAGSLLVQAVTTLAVDAAMKANCDYDPESETGGISVKDIGILARASKSVMEARKMSLKERHEIEQAAREKLIAEQRGKLDELGKTGDVPAQYLQKVIKAAYGLDV